MAVKRTFGIIGLGLIGGSLAKSLKGNNRHHKIIAYDVNKNDLKKACQDRICDLASGDEFIEFEECELIFICVPVPVFKETMERLCPHIGGQTILCDVGSTKTEIMNLAKQMGIEDKFIGGHPLAGSERSGYSASRANLFENAYFVMTPFEQTSSEHIERLQEIIHKTGAITLCMNAEIHDRVTAMISHVPHVVASLMVNSVKDSDTTEGYMHLLAAGGFKDITRIASSSSDLWKGICLSNRQSILDALTRISERLDGFIQDLDGGNGDSLKHFFEEARLYRDSFTDRSTGSYLKTFDITVDVDDKPGIIAKISTILAEQDINIKNIGINNVREEDEGALLIRFEDDDELNRGISILKNKGYSLQVRQ
jgi:prephenate dehydrogenase